MGYLVFTALMVGLLALLNCGQPAAVYLHYAINPFISGVSKFKINFFLAYILYLGSLAVLPGAGLGERAAGRLKFALAGLIGAALAANWLSFSLFVRRFSLPLDRYAYHFKGYDHSINYFGHTHTGKAVIAGLLALLHLDRLSEHYDTGLVFAGYVPVWLVLVLAVSVGAAFVVLTLLFKPVLAAWRGDRPALAFLIYALAGAHVLKCSIDGGVFSYDLLPSLFALQLLLTSSGAGALKENFRRRWRVYLFVSLLYFCVCSLLSLNEGLLQLPFGFIFTSACYALLFWALVRPVWSWRTGPVLAFCCLFIAGYWSMHALRSIVPMSQRLAPGDRIVYYDNSGAEVRALDRTAEAADRTLLEVYRRLGEDPLRNRRVAVIREGNDRYTGLICVLKLIKSGPLKLDPDQLIRIESLRPCPECGDRAYLLKIAFNPNLTPSLYGAGLTELDEENKYAALFLLDDYLVRRGAEEFAVIPFYYYKVGRI